MKTLALLLTIPLLYSCNATFKHEPKATVDTLGFQPAGAGKISVADSVKYATAVEHFLDTTLLKHDFNGSILVAKNGEVIYEHYAGYRDLKEKDSITANTTFQIASTSKTLTSAAILLLIQRGQLSLRQHVSDIIPGFPYTDITIKNLLSQRSGLPEYLFFFNRKHWEPTKYATNADVVNALNTWNVGRAFRPGTHFDYCNTNFVLLAYIVEKVTGVPFPVYMKLNIFEPLKMNSTHITFAPDSTHATQSYNYNGAPWPQDFSDGTYGDKNVYSTPRDLLKWDQALYGGKFLPQNLLDSAFTPFSNEKPSMHNYGLGWRLLMLPNGKKVIYHNGRWHGFNSAFARLTDEKVTIIILSNKFNKNVYFMARKMYNLFGNYDDKHADTLE